MNEVKVSVVIRNKNEGDALLKVLRILTRLYSSDIEEIILVDNNSTDKSLQFAKDFNVKTVSIQNFSYGRATNVGIAAAQSNYVLILSSHAIPIGDNFFKRSLSVLTTDPDIAGLRYINSFENYERALETNFKVNDPLNYGLMAACCMINKSVWEKFKFNEDLLAIEDKEWSKRVSDNGYSIKDINETYFYFLKRSAKQSRKRYKIETISQYRLQEKKFPHPLKSFAFFLKKALIKNPRIYFKSTWNDFKSFRINIQIFKMLKR